MMQGAQAPVHMAFTPRHHIPNSHMQIRGAYQQGGQRVQYVPVQQPEMIQQPYYQQQQQQPVYGNNYQYVYSSAQPGNYQPRPQSQPLMYIPSGKEIYSKFFNTAEIV